MDKNIIKETMLSLEADALQSAREKYFEYVAGAKLDRSEPIENDEHAQAAHRHTKTCRRKPRVVRKLDDPALWNVVQDLLRACWSPQQIAAILSFAFPDDQALRVSHETIYNAIYLIPRGELRKELVASLRQG
ncbi:MAG TPA: hypothetical protein VGM71_16505, partial [Luteibacter sp.]